MVIWPVLRDFVNESSNNRQEHAYVHYAGLLHIIYIWQDQKVAPYACSFTVAKRKPQLSLQH